MTGGPEEEEELYSERLEVEAAASCLHNTRLKLRASFPITPLDQGTNGEPWVCSVVVVVDG